MSMSLISCFLLIFVPKFSFFCQWQSQTDEFLYLFIFWEITHLSGARLYDM